MRSSLRATLVALGLVKGAPSSYLHLLGGLGPMLAASTLMIVGAPSDS